MIGYFGSLRKTTADYLRRNHGGEVASVFLSHGHLFEGDKLLEAYTNRPYGKLFKALDNLKDELSPMFESVPNPFPETEKKGGSNISPTKIKEIERLAKAGKSKDEIAKLVGVHRTTVYRHVPK